MWPGTPGLALSVDVECHAGYRGEETPRRFGLAGAEIERPDHRIHGHAVAIAKAVAEIDWPTVDNEQVDLRVRDAQRLYEILDCCAVVECAEEGRLPARGRQEVVERAVEANRH